MLGKKNMKNKVLLFRTIDRRLNIGLVISSLCIILVEVVFDKTEELFSGGAKLGEIVSNLSLAFIASYIFYVVVVHIKYMKDKEQLNPYILMKSRQIIAAIQEITLQLIVKAGAAPENKYPSKEKLKKIAKKIDLSNSAPDPYPSLHPHIETMSDFFYHWKKIGEQRIEALLVLAQFLDAEQIRLLKNIQESSFYLLLNNCEGKLNNDFSVISDSFYELSQSAKSLEEYCDREHLV